MFVLLLALALWFVFSPGLMSNDSLDQYSQAVKGTYHDWHPPVMAVFLGVAMRLGIGISGVILLQSVAGCFGLYLLVYVILAYYTKNRRVSDSSALAVLVLFLVPVTPFPFYLVTFWKDAWCAVLFLWICALAAALFLHYSRFSRSKFYTLYAVLSTLIVLVLLTRYNLIVAVPFLCVICGTIIYRKFESWKLALSLCLIPVVLFIAGRDLIHRGFKVEQTYPEQQVMALDMVSMVIIKPELLDEFSYLKKHLQDGYEQRFEWGRVEPLFGWGVAPIVTREYVNPPRYGKGHPVVQCMKDEYRTAIKRHPLIFSAVKFRAYGEMLFPPVLICWFQRELENNSFGLRQKECFAALRRGMLSIADASAGSWFRIISAMHLSWIMVNFGVAGTMLFMFFRKRRLMFLFWAALLCLPLAYYGAYLIAMTSYEYRFMYPSTLIIQVLVFSFSTAFLVSRRS